MSYANVLSSAANAAVNTYVSPRYSKLANRQRAPGQPAPPAFGIWFPIFAGHIAYGLLDESERSSEASIWNHLIAASGLTYAYTLVSERFYSMQASMAAMTLASFMYRKALPESSSKTAQGVRVAAELGVGWLVAADAVVGAQNIRRALGRPLKHREQDAVGLAEAAVVTGAALAANRLGWKGVSVAGAWALGGIALDRRSEKHVRIAAGVAAVGLLADLALKMRTSTASQAIDDSIPDENEVVLIEETLIPPNIVVEEITTVRI